MNSTDLVFLIHDFQSTGNLFSICLESQTRNVQLQLLLLFHSAAYLFHGFLAELFHLQARTGANFLATSRFIPEIEKEFAGRSTTLEIRASDGDLQSYLHGHMLRLPSFVSHSADLQNEVKTAIIKAVDGMYVPLHTHNKLNNLADARSGSSSHSFIWIH